MHTLTSALLASFLAASFAPIVVHAQNQVTVQIVNDSGLPDEKVFVLLATPKKTGQSVSDIELLADSGGPSSSKEAVPLSSLKAVVGKIVKSPLTGKSNQVYSFVIQNLESGRLFVSYGTKVSIINGSNPTAFAPYRFDKMEISYLASANEGKGGGGGNLTSLDFYGIPLQVEVTHDKANGPDELQTKSFYASTSTLLKKLAALSPAMKSGAGWTAATGEKTFDPQSKDFSTFLRIFGPGTVAGAAGNIMSSAAPYPSFDLYLASLVGKQFDMNNPAEGYKYKATVMTDDKGGFDIVASGTLTRTTYKVDDKDVPLPAEMISKAVSVHFPKAIARGPNDAPKSMDFFIYACEARLDSYAIADYPFDNKGGDADTAKRFAVATASPYAAIVRDIHAALNFGYFDSKLVPPGAELENVFSETVLPYPYPYGGARVKNDGFYNPFAALFYYHSDAYGHPYSDRLDAASPLYKLTPNDTIRVTILPDVRLDAPLASVTGQTDNSITVSWPNVTDATGYSVEVSPAEGNSTVARDSSGSTWTGTLTGLAPGTPYLIRVTANKGDGTSSNSLAIQGVTTGARIPLTGTKIRFESAVSVPEKTAWKEYLQYFVNGSEVVPGGQQATINADLGLNRMGLAVKDRRTGQTVHQSNYFISLVDDVGGKFRFGTPFQLQNNQLPLSAASNGTGASYSYNGNGLVISTTITPKPVFQYFDTVYPSMQIYNSLASSAAISPGTFVTVKPGGSDVFGTETDVRSTSAALPASLGNLQVLVNGGPAPIQSVSPRQINFVLPTQAASQSTAELRILNQGSEVATGSFALSPIAPAFLTWNQDGRGQVRGWNYVTIPPLGSIPVVNVPGFGVAPAEAITVFGVGFGSLPGDLAAGVPPSASYIGSKSDITFQLAGKTLPPENILEFELPAATIGFWRVKLLIPADAATGDFVPLSASVKGVPTPAGAPATIAIRPNP